MCLVTHEWSAAQLFPTPEYSSKQPSDPVVPLVPCTGIFLGPSKSGKTVTLISLILEQYRGVFERIYIFSPSIDIDDGWIPVKKYIEEDLGVNTEREQAYWDEWDEAALRRIIQQQRKITEASKKLETKKLYQVLIICDDLADVPQLHRPNGALDTLFIRGRHTQISTWVSLQKLRLISAAVRVNQQFLCCWRLRNQHELDAVVGELLPKEQLYQLYEQATREPWRSAAATSSFKIAGLTRRTDQQEGVPRAADSPAGRAVGARAGGAFHPPLSLLRPGRGEQRAALRGGAMVQARARRVPRVPKFEAGKLGGEPGSASLCTDALPGFSG